MNMLVVVQRRRSRAGFPMAAVPARTAAPEAVVVALLNSVG